MSTTSHRKCSDWDDMAIDETEYVTEHEEDGDDLYGIAMEEASMVYEPIEDRQLFDALVKEYTDVVTRPPIHSVYIICNCIFLNYLFIRVLDAPPIHSCILLQ
jgi:hypothetical protein